MADIDIRELRLYEPVCTSCGEAGPLEDSTFAAFAWEQSHDCVAARAEQPIAVAS
jgi:hypothetical protein